MTASHTTTDDARIPDHCGWAARGYWREAYDDAVAALRQVTAERDAWKEGAGAHHVASMQQAQRADRAEVAKKTEVATLRAELDAARGRVKPLVWREPADGRGLIATTVVGQYAVFDEGSPRWAFSVRGGYTYHPVKDMEAAKSAAQADYTARILSALEPDPAVVRMREALELAANRLHRCSVDYDTGTYEFIETGEWADEARAALQEE